MVCFSRDLNSLPRCKTRMAWISLGYSFDVFMGRKIRNSSFFRIPACCRFSRFSSFTVFGLITVPFGCPYFSHPSTSKQLHCVNQIYFCKPEGLTSSLGKGIICASLGRLLTARGLNVTIQKLDPYINVDPGTMNPYEHGEVYVTDDGAETDSGSGALWSVFWTCPTSQQK